MMLPMSPMPIEIYQRYGRVNPEIVPPEEESREEKNRHTNHNKIILKKGK